MRKITRQEIVCEIWSSRSSQFQEFILTKKWISCPYNFDNFVRDMYRNDPTSSFNSSGTYFIP